MSHGVPLALRLLLAPTSAGTRHWQRCSRRRSPDYLTTLSRVLPRALRVERVCSSAPRPAFTSPVSPFFSPTASFLLYTLPGRNESPPARLCLLCSFGFSLIVNKTLFNSRRRSSLSSPPTPLTPDARETSRAGLLACELIRSHDGLSRLPYSASTKRKRLHAIFGAMVWRRR